MRPTPLLTLAMLEPQRCTGLTPAQWDVLVRQARRANLLASLALRLQAQGVQAAVPAQVWQHCASALLLAERQLQHVRAEVGFIRAALAPLDTPIVLLKGAAYALTGHPAAAGRMFSDVDILVRRERLAEVETALLVAGWSFGEIDAYDQRYYRLWMHELPALQHIRRGTALDVHHTLLPPTAATKIDSAALFDDLVAVPGQPGVFVLSPEAMLLHSAVHLFHEGEMDNGLRDLFDLDALLRHLGGATLDAPALLARADRLGLTHALVLALRYAQRLLDTPIPAALSHALAARAPGTLARRALDFAFERGLQPQHSTCRRPGTPLALAALYVRSHWLRMPVHLLAFHLGRKVVRRYLWPEKPPAEPA